eukprot:jgi/Hompol1/7077/HPOL_005190-RA
MPDSDLYAVLLHTAAAKQPKDEHLMDLHDVCKKHRTTVNFVKPSQSVGLRPGEATEKMAVYGPNAMTPPKRKHWTIKFLECLGSLFNVMLIAAGVAEWILFFLDQINNFENTYIGSILIGIAFVNSFIELYQIQKSAAILDSFMKMVPSKCSVVRAGLVRQIPATGLVPGDVVFIRLGDKIPADILVFAANEFKVDNSSLTGESEPQQRTPKNTSLQPNPLEATNLCFNGTLAVCGEAYGIVIRTGDSTVLGQIAKLATAEGKRPSPLTVEIERFCKIITAVAILTAAFFFFYSLLGGRGLNNALSFAVGVLVAWVPQGLPATVTMLLTIAAKRMSSQQVLVKDLQGVETLGAITLLATDKTGTLTRNQMTVAYLWVGGVMWRASPAVVPDGDDQPDQLENNSSQSEVPEQDWRADAQGMEEMLHAFILCASARFDRTDVPVPERVIHGDATETGLFKFASARLRDFDKVIEDHPKAFEIPFNSTTKTHMAIVHKPRPSSFYTIYVKGAPERVFKLCSWIHINGEVVRLGQEHDRWFNVIYETMAHKGHRVIAFAQQVLPSSEFPDTFEFSKETKNYPLDGYCFMGLASLEDPPKHGVREAVGQARIAGIKVVMVTGDHPLTAEAIARKINLVLGDTKESLARRTQRAISDIADWEASAIVVHGDNIPKLTADDWDAIFDKEEIIFARTSPKHKLQIVKHAQALGHIVGVTGDGVNDSPALKKADLGIAMNKTGSDVSKEAAGMILLDDNFSSIIRGITEGRLIFINLKKSIQYAVTHIIPEVVPYILFVILPIPAALTPVQVLAVDLGFELMASLSFAFEPAESVKDLMCMKPRRPVTKEYTTHLRHGVVQRQMLLPPTENSENSDESEEFELPARYREYAQELKRMTHWQYWRELFAPPPGGEVLVDADVLCWSYLEAGVLECVGCLVTFFAVFSYNGMDPGTVISAQRAGGHFLPHSRPLYVPSTNMTISGDDQYETLKQAQSAYYLSILVIQMWNLFACKSKLKMPWGVHMIQNDKTWISILSGMLLGSIIVYAPIVSDIFLTSNNLNLSVLIIPFGFGALLLGYAALRRLFLSQYDQSKRSPEVQGLMMHPTTWSI